MWGLFLGAFLGPFGGNVVQVLLPVLQRWYDVDVQAAALSITAYMVPFAAAQFFSGALADRYGRRPVVVAGFGAFGLASLVAGAAPWYGLFLAARAGQGLANACTTPILMATLGDRVEAGRLGRSLGWFAAANTAGLFLAPLVAGALALVDWRLVYLLLAAVCAWLTVHYARWLAAMPGATTDHRSFDKVRTGFPSTVEDEGPFDKPRAGSTKDEVGDLPRPSLVLRQAQDERRSAVGGRPSRFAALCLAALLGYLSLNGVGFLVALYLAGAFGLDPGRSGALLSAFGLANMLAAGPAGWAADRFGRLPVSAAGTVGAAAVLALVPLAPSPPAIGVLLFLGGIAVAALWAGLTTLAVSSSSERRATASSIFNAWKFVGYALAPVVYVPVYSQLGFAAAFTASAGATGAILVPLAYLAAASPR
ncbi:MAG: MFS transporter [Chloroflexi bacterium]|nr:MFS transporter [Chloroflexota bacterium]